ncbi:MAG: ROK family protein [Clostridiales bacterium]|nr:ROK family protein [Clostridiales bacterium]
MRKEENAVFCGAVDVGGTKIASALFAENGRMLGRARTNIDKGTADEPVRQIIGIIKGLQELARIKNGHVQAVGICVPGVVFEKSGLVWAPNIPGWDHFPLRGRLEKKTKIPLVLDSDRSAYVLGEQWLGAARGKRDVVFLAVGTGIGAGIIAGGKLIRGSQDVAGAVGWFGLNQEFKEEYVKMGCFEAEAAGSAVGRKARQLLRDGQPSSMRKIVRGRIERVTAETVVRAARARDALARKIITEVSSYLAMGIANIVSILNPEMVVLGGGLFQAGDFLLKPVKKEFRKWAQPLAAQKVRIVLSALGEDAGLCGAGRLAWLSIEQRKHPGP